VKASSSVVTPLYNRVDAPTASLGGPSRSTATRWQLAVDGALVALAYYLAFQLRSTR
jgi:hypothetical protein